MFKLTLLKQIIIYIIRMGEVIINEEWRSISEFMNYQVSNIGRIRNAKTGKILKTTLNNTYPSVSLQNNGKQFLKRVRRLVATEFILNVENKPMVDHIDGDRTNNIVSNLRWVSCAANSRNYGVLTTKSSSKYKGVFKHGRGYMGQIQYNRKFFYLGTYDDEEGAAKAYDEKAKELFGEYAKLNFP